MDQEPENLGLQLVQPLVYADLMDPPIMVEIEQQAEDLAAGNHSHDESHPGTSRNQDIDYRTTNNHGNRSQVFRRSFNQPEPDPNDVGQTVAYQWTIPSNDIDRHPSNAIFTTGHICGFESPTFHAINDHTTLFQLTFIPNVIFQAGSTLHSISTNSNDHPYVVFGTRMEYDSMPFRVSRFSGAGSLYLQLVSCEIDSLKCQLQVSVSRAQNTQRFEMLGVCKKGAPKNHFGLEKAIKWRDFGPSNYDNDVMITCWVWTFLIL